MVGEPPSGAGTSRPRTLGPRSGSRHRPSGSPPQPAVAEPVGARHASPSEVQSEGGSQSEGKSQAGSILQRVSAALQKVVKGK